MRVWMILSRKLQGGLTQARQSAPTDSHILNQHCTSCNKCNDGPITDVVALMKSHCKAVSRVMWQKSLSFMQLTSHLEREEMGIRKGMIPTFLPQQLSNFLLCQERGAWGSMRGSTIVKRGRWFNFLFDPQMTEGQRTANSL